jgi:uncharacterized membrane protein
MATLPTVYSQQIAIQQQITGPLPPPEILRKYEELSPGLINRIVKLAEGEADHRRSMEAEIISIQGRDQKAYRIAELIGLFCGLAIGLSAVFGAVYAAIHGAQIAGSLIGTGGVTGLAFVFVMGRSALLKMRQQDIDQQEAIRKEQLDVQQQAEQGKVLK